MGGPLCFGTVLCIPFPHTLHWNNYLNNYSLIINDWSNPLLFDLFEKCNSTELFVPKPRSNNYCPNGFSSRQAAIKDSDKRLAEIKRERHDFEQFVAKTHQTTPVLAQRAQKVIGYIERKIKAKVSWGLCEAWVGMCW